MIDDVGDSLRGRLLVATPSLLADPNFDRTVVLVLEHGDDGALGVVLNRPSETAVAEPLPRWGDVACEPGVVFIGGPVAPSAVIALARGEARNDTEGWVPVGDDVVSVDLERMPEDLGRIDALRVFAGCAGWTPGQLEGELEANGWFVCDALPGDPFTPEPEALWRTVLGRQPGRLAWYANYPPHPSFN